MKAAGLALMPSFILLNFFLPRTISAEDAALAGKARQVLQTHCYRCHGKDGTLEGGMSYILDRNKLVARRKIIPADAANSPLYKRVATGKMPPPEESTRPSKDEIAVLRKWID